MDFLLNTGAGLLKPEHGELEAYFDANRDAYLSAPRLAFEQIYLGQSPSPETVAATLSALNGEPGANPATVGERSLLPAQLGLSKSTAVDGVFGTGFFERIIGLEAGKWAGPVPSPYGEHLVRVIDTLPSAVPALKDIRALVVRNWRLDKAQDIRDRDYAARRKRYSVRIERGDGAAGAGQ